MQIIVCVDNSNGMMLNRRRLSRDRILTERIVELVKGKRLLVNTYSYELFEKMPDVYVDDDFLSIAEDDDICFVENESLQDFVDKIDQLYVFKWNRDYPADFYFDIALDEWKLLEKREYKGNSHEKITEEIYIR